MAPDEKVISIIVPVYNVGQYLRRCLDSIVRQTYRKLEILVIDDGSTDGSGEICEEYLCDQRVRIFHTENRGIPCARNLGLDEAKGEWIGFVDADDWIEDDMFEVLWKRAEETGADVVECGLFKEYPNKTEDRKQENRELDGMEALRLLLRSELTNYVWSKLWRRSCFADVRFPENRVYEDVVTTYRVLTRADTVCTIAESKYHYCIRKGSLSKKYTLQNLAGYWQSTKERTDSLWDKMDEAGRRDLVRWCALAAARTWAHYYDSPPGEREKYRGIVMEMNAYSREHIRLFGDRGWEWETRLGSFFPHYYNAFSFMLARLLNRMINVMH